MSKRKWSFGLGFHFFLFHGFFTKNKRSCAANSPVYLPLKASLLISGEAKFPTKMQTCKELEHQMPEPGQKSLSINFIESADEKIVHNNRDKP